MNKKVFIIHSSAIVQHGLTDILNRSFKCAINSFGSLADFKTLELIINEKSILLVEDTIANSLEYIEFMVDSPNTTSFSIHNCDDDKELINKPYSFNINNSDKEIYAKLKPYLIQKVERRGSDDLSSREIDVLKLVAQGFSNKDMAEKLFITTHTVMSHRKKITEKLGIKSISGLTVYAIINNYIDTENIDIKDLI